MVLIEVRLLSSPRLVNRSTIFLDDYSSKEECPVLEKGNYGVEKLAIS